MKKGVEITPEENYRIRSEDLFDVSVVTNNNFAKKGVK